MKKVAGISSPLTNPVTNATSESISPKIQWVNTQLKVFASSRLFIKRDLFSDVAPDSH
jgi:hypothetical protein